MPLKGRQRTENQKAHTAAMQKRRWLPKSLAKTEAIDPATSRLLSNERKKHKRELERARRDEFNSRRRAQRAQEKLKKVKSELQVQIEEVAEVEERYVEKLQELRRRRF